MISINCCFVCFVFDFLNVEFIEIHLIIVVKVRNGPKKFVLVTIKY